MATTGWVVGGGQRTGMARGEAGRNPRCLALARLCLVSSPPVLPHYHRAGSCIKHKPQRRRGKSKPSSVKAKNDASKRRKRRRKEPDCRIDRVACRVLICALL